MRVMRTKHYCAWRLLPYHDAYGGKQSSSAVSRMCTNHSGGRLRHERRRSALWAGCLMFAVFAARAQTLAPGEPAPAFQLTDQQGQPHALADYRGRWVVLYFYPKDDTPGCTTEACAFRDDLRQLQRMHVALLGISLDSVASHRAFAEKYALPFPLLADSEQVLRDLIALGAAEAAGEAP